MDRAAVAGGAVSSVALVAADSFSWPVGAGEEVTTSIRLDASLRAPLSAGQQVGEAVFALDGRELGRVALLCGSDVMPHVEPAMAVLKIGLPE